MQQRGLLLMRYLLLVSIGISPAAPAHAGDSASLIPVQRQPRRMWQINHTPTKSRYPHEFGRHRAMVSTPSTVGHRWGECEMSSINSSWRAGSGAHRFGCGPRTVSSSGTGVALRLLAAGLTAAALAACAQ